MPGHRQQDLEEFVAVEEPLELRLHTLSSVLPLAVLMRTPGHDRELLLGWLIAEGLFPSEFHLEPEPENPNVWHLHTPEHERLSLGARLGVSSSACGVCGTGSIERLTLQAEAPIWTGGPLDPTQIAALPELLRATQTGFTATGGLHAAGLFLADGTRLCTFEDVGRHNAVDKTVGWAHARKPLSAMMLCVSSRAGLEIVQKAVMAGVAVVVSVGAASSLAIDTAQMFGVTLCAFTREGRFTVYSGAERIV